MKKHIKLFSVLVASILLISPMASSATGNGALSGAHYNLNLIGTSKTKTAALDLSDGHRIFVNLESKSRIMLSEGAEFKVLDGNGTDGTASFQLPNPDADNDGVTSYSVYARAVGKPGGHGTLNTGATAAGDDGIFGTADDEEVYSVEVLEIERSKGKSSFENVSNELLYVYVDLNDDGVVERYPLFDSALQGYFWDFDNAGLKVVQLRFYPSATDVN